MKTPRLVVAPDGSQLAMIEDTRVTVVDATTMTARAEIGLVGEDTDVALVGTPARLVIVTRTEADTRLFVVDPTGPEKLGDAVTRAGMRIGATGGDLLLLVGATTAVFDTRTIERAPSTLPTRGAVTEAGPMGDTRVAMVIGNGLEEWDLATRSPVRRLRLDRTLDVQAIGGSDSRVWMVLKSAPTKVEIVNVTTRSTRVVELPDAIVKLHAHPTIDVLVAVCASGSAYVVRADLHVAPAKVARAPLHDIGWVGGYLVAWPIDGYPELVPSPIDLGEAAHRNDTAAQTDEAAAADDEPPQTARISSLSQPSFSERLASWKAKLEEQRAAAPTAAPGADGPLAPPPIDPERAEVTAAILERRAAGGWRGELATWARSMLSRSPRPMPYLDPGVLDELMVRCGLAPAVRPGVALLYGAHLLGAGGVPRYELASAIEWRWEELATGGLARAGLVRERGERVELVREATRALDGGPPRRGTLIGAGTGDPGDRALVAPATTDPQSLAAWGANLAGAPLFVANAKGLARPARFVLEARIRGAVPVVTDEAIAAEHQLVVAGRWSELGVA